MHAAIASRRPVLCRHDVHSLASTFAIITASIATTTAISGSTRAKPTSTVTDSPPTIGTTPPAPLRLTLLTTALTLATAAAIAPERAPARPSAAAISLWTTAASSGSARAEPTALVPTTGCAAGCMRQSLHLWDMRLTVRRPHMPRCSRAQL